MLTQVLTALQNQDLLRAQFLLKEILASSPNNLDAMHLMGIVCGMMGRPNEALPFFEQCLQINPQDAMLRFNLAKALSSLQRDGDALEHHQQAAKLDPSNQDIWLNYGRSLDNLRKRKEALACYEKAVSLKPDLMEGWFNKGKILGELKCYDEALNSYMRAYQLRPTEPFLLGIILHYKMLICDWADLDGLYEHIQQNLRNGLKIVEPFGFQGISHSESDLLLAAKIFANERYPLRQAGPILAKPIRKKIRAAYLCGEFRDQATSVLMTGVYESHDKEKFEIFALDNGWNDGSVLRNRMEQAFQEMIDISSLSDEAVAELIKNLDIDILVNLNGYFGEARPNVFARHPAPIQVNFLGFPGTLGASYMDYLIADPIIIPPTSQEYYVEKIAYMPNSYQANDSKRIISDRIFSRSELGLPENGFVYCCFNNNYKITPQTFDCWMRILKAVDGSVLWLIEDNVFAANNLRIEAKNRGVSPDRIIFATRLSLPDHLARHSNADLFLDTLPYNAHTTASDALWTGLPVLTCLGNTFPGRVATSLLSALEMPELITNSMQEYENLAVELANSHDKFQAIKNKLLNHLNTKSLFDTQTYTRDLEDLYQKMYDRYQANLNPEHLY
ncbi:tetratricopeptide repeat protein [Polynucleobacter sp. MWH-Braz-FAM2G]|uniref:O-linked N-acetylglucosamine transferase, SPINDLY family protein n=1 Tax=Polynucleobacter sp. MWH-Braz-FAM2G TaxID=1855883 RepID=UPI001BFDAEC4|nr:tetratricopeptide repeat protein [Polynucleobacter sp. MWH-Braz-FAM2G]QWD90314.1 hypothetical protein FD973_08460 [Polynucleobacter sp. MWH-Braz-FAM2G]